MQGCIMAHSLARVFPILSHVDYDVIVCLFFGILGPGDESLNPLSTGGGGRRWESGASVVNARVRRVWPCDHAEVCCTRHKQSTGEQIDRERFELSWVTVKISALSQDSSHRRLPRRTGVTCINARSYSLQRARRHLSFRLAILSLSLLKQGEFASRA